MYQGELRQAVFALAWAATPKDIVETLKRFPYLQKSAVDDALTWEIQTCGSRQERVLFLAVRSFLKDLRAERNVGTALQRAECLPLVMSCPVEELLRQGGRINPVEQEKIAKKLIRQVRVESEIMLYVLAKYFLSEALYRKEGIHHEQDLRTAEEVIKEVVNITRDQPALHGIWKEAFQLLSHIWEDIAESDLPENAKEIIELYEEALRRENWNAANSEQARLLHSLGYLYTMRPTTDRYASIETGIQRLKESLNVLGQDHQHQSALSWNDLGNAYIERVGGEPVENFRQALDYYEMARKVHARALQEGDAKASEHLARVEYNASVACRVLAEQTYNDTEADRYIATGIKHAKKALGFYRSESNIRMLAKVQSEIGKLHYYHRGERDKHLLQSIAYIEAALLKINRQQEPVHWGNTNDSLANAYSECRQGKRKRNLKKAIYHYRQALKEFRRKNYPQHWATVQNDLGATYADIGRPDLARKCFRAAALVRRAERLPYDTRQTATNLGNLEFFQKNWIPADQAYSKALDAAERLYQSSYLETGKKAEQSKRFLLTQRSAYAAVMRDIARGNVRAPWWRNGNDRALLILEKNKTRMLSERMQSREEQPEKAPDNVWKRYQSAAAKVRSARLPESNLERHNKSFTKEMEASAADMRALREAISDLRTHEPDFLKEFGAQNLCGVIQDARTALIAFCITELGSIGLILSKTGHVKSVPLPRFSLQRLQTWLHGKKGKGTTTEEEGWLAACETPSKRVEALLAEIGRDLVEPVLKRLDPSIDRLLILPTGGLFLVPFQAVPLQERGGLVIDHFEVVYSPSIKVMIKHRAQQSEAGHAKLKSPALAIIGPEPGGDALNLGLFYSDVMETALRSIEQGLDLCPREETAPREKKILEEKVIVPETFRILTGAQCTKDEMLKQAQGCTELHFYGHGTFDQVDPLKSTLILTNGERLTLGELQKQAGDLSSIRLLTLTACESGIPETEELPEEYISLPGGFMQAGVPRVISTLWTVNERASVMLLAFFHEHYHYGDDPAEALRKAQRRLRTITHQELANLPVFSGSDAWGVRNLHTSFRKDAQKDPGGRPFEHPYYWAAFTINGCLRERLME